MLPFPPRIPSPPHSLSIPPLTSYLFLSSRSFSSINPPLHPRPYLTCLSRYFTSIMAAAVTLCTFLATFIIFGMVLASAIVGPQFLSPTAHIGCNQFYLAAPSNLPCPRSSLHLYKVTQVLGAIALGCLLFGCIFFLLSILLFSYIFSIYI